MLYPSSVMSNQKDRKEETILMTDLLLPLVLESERQITEEMREGKNYSLTIFFQYVIECFLLFSLELLFSLFNAEGTVLSSN